MEITVQCACGKKFKAPEKLAGKTVRCPVCKQPLNIPAPVAQLDPLDLTTDLDPLAPEPMAPPSAPAAPAAAPAPAPTPAPVPVACACGNQFQVAANYVGQQVVCPRCSSPCMVSAPGAQPVVLQPVAPAAPFAPPQSFPAAAPRPAAGAGMPNKSGVGVLVVAIALCAFSATLGIALISETLYQLAGSKILSIRQQAQSQSKKMRRLSSDTSMDFNARMSELQRQQKSFQEQAKNNRERLQSANKLAETSKNLLKFARLLGLLTGIACIVGYVFSLFAPGRLMGLAIAALSLAVVTVLLQLIFQVIPLFNEEKEVYDMLLAGTLAGGQKADFGDILLAMVIEICWGVQFLLFSIYAFSIGSMRNHRQVKLGGLVSTFVFGGFCVIVLILGIWCSIEVAKESVWPIYVGWVFRWLGNICMIVGLVFLIRACFQSKGALARKPATRSYARAY